MWIIEVQCSYKDKSSDQFQLQSDNCTIFFSLQCWTIARVLQVSPVLSVNLLPLWTGHVPPAAMNDPCQVHRIIEEQMNRNGKQLSAYLNLHPIQHSATELLYLLPFIYRRRHHCFGTSVGHLSRLIDVDQQWWVKKTPVSLLRWNLYSANKLCGNI